MKNDSFIWIKVIHGMPTPCTTLTPMNKISMSRHWLLLVESARTMTRKCCLSEVRQSNFFLSFYLENFFYCAIIVEHAECSPIIIQNSSNPSSNTIGCTTVRPYDHMTVQPHKVLLLTCAVNCTAGTPKAQLCPVVQWSMHWAPSWMTWVQGKALCLYEDLHEKKMHAPPLGLAKSIY